jgi:hypothetical protein
LSTTPQAKYLPEDASHGHLLAALAAHPYGVRGADLAAFLHDRKTPVYDPTMHGWSVYATTRQAAWLRSNGYPVYKDDAGLWHLGEPRTKAVAEAMFACLVLAYFDQRPPAN